MAVPAGQVVRKEELRMQSYMYSIFSAVAIVIHLTINFDLLMGRGETGVRGSRYRGFLWGVLFYYVADASWGLFAGLGLLVPWYVDTILFFLSLPVFALAWCRFLVVYLGLGKSAARMLLGIGYALVAASVAALAANFHDGCVFCFDGCGKYHCGWMRDPLFHLLIAYNALMAEFAFMKAIRSDGPARSRNMMVFLHCLTVTIALWLQVLWPLTPFTALGCLIGNCFLHIFVVRDEQSARHAEELERALEQTRAADKARSLFFSIVSHDIRTPLNAILGYSELLQRGMESDAERDEALKAIRASGTTLLQLVNDVLDMAKMDAGRMPLHPGPVRIDRLADEVLATFRLAASGKGVELVNRVDAAQAVMLDGHRVRQVLFNLVGNAVKFTARGSVTVAASYDGTRLRVSVADTGCGIPREMQSRIFDPFVQVNDPNHSTYKAIGTGLGLSICRRLVGMMGGTISVESEPGRGSTFLVELPG
ncbi:MAG: HAMP domain-containing histidine kinase, partial [Kiritimatiellae bacterium]|nr:HAMP domain-containing histidine kinase [Kiritimatiellia bacterium]